MSEELEKLQETNATLQKANLLLESENLELRLDLEKHRTDTPRLKEQIQHLETLVSHCIHIFSTLLVSFRDETCRWIGMTSQMMICITHVVMYSDFRYVSLLKTENAEHGGGAGDKDAEVSVLTPPHDFPSKNNI